MKKVLLVTVLALSGCTLPQASPGNEAVGSLNSAKDLAWIKKGITTTDDVTQRLGEPGSSDVSNGETTYTYEYACQPKMANAALLLIPGVSLVANHAAAAAKDCHGHKISNTRVQVNFDTTGRVINYTFSLSTRD